MQCSSSTFKYTFLPAWDPRQCMSLPCSNFGSYFMMSTSVSKCYGGSFNLLCKAPNGLTNSSTAATSRRPRKAAPKAKSGAAPKAAARLVLCTSQSAGVETTVVFVARIGTHREQAPKAILHFPGQSSTPTARLVGSLQKPQNSGSLGLLCTRGFNCHGFSKLPKLLQAFMWRPGRVGILQ